MNGKCEFTATTDRPHKIIHCTGIVFEPEKIKKAAHEVIGFLKGRSLSYVEAEMVLSECLKLLDTEAKL